VRASARRLFADVRRIRHCFHVRHAIGDEVLVSNAAIHEATRRAAMTSQSSQRYGSRLGRNSASRA
jgi:hypothetical protein